MQQHLQPLRDQVAREFGVQFGSKEHNRNLTAAQCGQVGGEMVRRALSQVWGSTGTITASAHTAQNPTMGRLQ